MPVRPTPGAPYTIVKGDNLSKIARIAYGQASKWRDIWAANESVLRSGDPNLIYPGEVINIPPDAVEEELITELIPLPTLEGKDKDDCTIVIEGIELPVESCKSFRAIDTCAHTWSARIAWTPEDARFAEALKPYKYPEAECYLGGKLVVKGLLYSIEPANNENGRSMVLEGWSKTADVVDSTIKPPYEQTNITLEKRAKQLVEPLGIPVKIAEDPLTRIPLISDEPFAKVTCAPEDTIFKHLSELGSQRGILISSSPLGELLLTVAAFSESIGTIEEIIPPGREFKTKFDGRKRFNVYKALGQSPQKTAVTAVAKDNAVPKSRFQTFKANDANLGNIQNAANWRRSKQLADALTIPFPVDSWYGPNKLLWSENTIVTVKSDTIFVPGGFDFLIRSVEFTFQGSGTVAVLNLVPPQVFTGGELVEPWAFPSSEEDLLASLREQAGI